jgi:hypothetical protein
MGSDVHTLDAATFEITSGSLCKAKLKAFAEPGAYSGRTLKEAVSDNLLMLRLIAMEWIAPGPERRRKSHS